MEVDMASNQKGSKAERLTHPLLENLGPLAAATESLFAYSAKIVCGRQIDSGCCCIAGARPGVYATEVNIQNVNLVTAPVIKFVLPLLNSGAVVAREPDIAGAATLSKSQVEIIKIPPLGATMDDCCRVVQSLLGATPSGDPALTIAILTIVSQFELSVSAVYTATSLNGDGISIDVEYVPSRLLPLRSRG